MLLHWLGRAQILLILVELGLKLHGSLLQLVASFLELGNELGRVNYLIVHLFWGTSHCRLVPVDYVH